MTGTDLEKEWDGNNRCCETAVEPARFSAVKTSHITPPPTDAEGKRGYFKNTYQDSITLSFALWHTYRCIYLLFIYDTEFLIQRLLCGV